MTNSPGYPIPGSPPIYRPVPIATPRPAIGNGQGPRAW